MDGKENENTLTSYLGPEFQQKLMWQILVEPEFAERVMPDLHIDYFDDPNLKRLFIIFLEYYKNFEKVPNLQNKSVYQAINLYKTPHNLVEEETLYSIIEKIKLWNEGVLNKTIQYDGDVVQKSTTFFIKQQEFRKLGEYIIAKTKTGGIKDKHTVAEIEDKIRNIERIGDEEDYGTDIIDDIDNVLRKEFRETIPTGIEALDVLTGGGLGRGEIGMILTPSGVGKSTILTKIANTAYISDKKVLQIIFEDTEEQIKRKHYTIWSKIPLSKIDDRTEDVKERVIKANRGIEDGKLVIKRFSQENTTMLDIRSWIDRYQKKFGFKFDIVVLDYLDCLESHKKNTDRNEAELAIIKSFLAMAADFDIPCWSALQSNRSGFDAEFIDASHAGGNIKRIQKSHFFMSIAKPHEMKETHLANIRIMKARFAQDGQTFKDCTFNNDTMEIKIHDNRYKFKKKLSVDPEEAEARINRLNEKINKLNKQQEGDVVEEEEQDSSETYKFHTEVSKKLPPVDEETKRLSNVEGFMDDDEMEELGGKIKDGGGESMSDDEKKKIDDLLKKNSE